MEGNLLAARAVGLAATGANLAASHATTSAKPITLLRKRRNAASAFLWHANASFTTPPFILCHVMSEFWGFYWTLFVFY